MCTYHGWTFSNEGRLVSVPGLQEAYYGELEVEELGLVEARCETYAGLIFACWDEEAPDLEAYLGDARWYLDLRFNRRDCGMQAMGPQKWIEPSNWKMSVDNSSETTTSPSATSRRRWCCSAVTRRAGQGPAVPGTPRRCMRARPGTSRSTATR